ncbi:MAG TPA: AAA family ATPase [Gemmataceae bacterium]|nr:AAA family ATPase [Gemmataceae bacterium]
MIPLFERYRPRSFAEVVGQDKVVARIQALAKRGLGGRAFWLTGQSGTGKTTLARLLAAEVADDFMIREIDAGTLTVSALTELEQETALSGWGNKAGRAVIINESHGLRRDTIRQLLVTLERIPGHVLWIFTTTNEAQEALFEDYPDASPLLSRCLRLDLARRDLAKAFALRAQWIAQQEGLDGRPLDTYLRLVQKHRQNLRAVLQEVEAGAMLAE